MQLGIIGFGNIGKQHYHVLSAFKEISRIHIYDPTIKVKNTTIDDEKAVFHESPETVLKRVNGVVIPTPNHFHVDYILLAAQKDIYVLCEKPLCSNRKELVYLLKEIQNPSLFNIGFNYRFLNIAEEIKKFTQKYKDIKFIKLVFYKDSAFRKKTFTWRESGISGFSSGTLGDLGIHLIDLMWYFIPSPPMKNTLKLDIKTQVSTRCDQRIMLDDHAHLIGKLANHVNFEMITSKSREKHECGIKIIIEANEATLEYYSSNPWYHIRHNNKKVNQILLRTTINQDPENEIYGWSDSFFYQHATWLQKIKKNDEDEKLADFSDAIRSQAILCDAFDKIPSFNLSDAAQSAS